MMKYTIYDTKTNKILVSGSSKECAEKLNKNINSFKYFLRTIRLGQNTSYRIEQNQTRKEPKIWLQEEIDFLYENHKKLDKFQLSQHLKKSVYTITTKCRTLGIKPISKTYVKTKDTICWQCKKYYKKCSWSACFKPVDGWIAKETELGFCVKECPLFERG